jgi:hypothetical protein
VSGGCHTVYAPDVAQLGLLHAHTVSATGTCLAGIVNSKSCCSWTCCDVTLALVTLDYASLAVMQCRDTGSSCSLSSSCRQLCHVVKTAGCSRFFYASR